ncbi:MAG: hypothetical protein HKL95_05515 [Phycisphaerae bacterium]|nr:hypothetical protein [Phycisphaerae bacterium]
MLTPPILCALAKISTLPRSAIIIAGPVLAGRVEGSTHRRLQRRGNLTLGTGQ